MLLAMLSAPIAGKIIMGLWAAMVALGAGSAIGGGSHGTLSPPQYHEIAAP